MLGCVVNFPLNRFIRQLAITRTYIVNENPPYIELYHTENGKISTKKIDVEKFGIRLLILTDVSLRTVMMGMSTKLMVGDLFTMLRMDMTKEESELERDLCLRFRTLLSGKENVDGIEKFGDCYRKVLECFENGGL